MNRRVQSAFSFFLRLLVIVFGIYIFWMIDPRPVKELGERIMAEAEKKISDAAIKIIRSAIPEIIYIDEYLSVDEPVQTGPDPAYMEYITIAGSRGDI